MSPNASTQNLEADESHWLGLLDPFENVLARVPPNQVENYLRTHSLESETDLGIEPTFPEDYRNVFPREYHLILSRIYDLPRIEFFVPRLPFEEYRLDSQICNRAEFEEQIKMKLNLLLKKFPFVVYQSTLWESESFEFQYWRRWVETDLLPDIVNAEIILPAGRYPKFQGAVFGRLGAGPVEGFLSVWPRTPWVEAI